MENYTNRDHFGGLGNKRHVPTATRLKVLFGGVTNFMGWFFFGFGMVFVWVFVMNMDLGFWYFSADSPKTTGKITKVGATNSTVNKQRVYACYYEFRTTEGKTFQGISYAYGNYPQEDFDVTVQYVAKDPSISKVEGLSQGAFPPFVLFILIFPLVGLIFIFFNTRYALKALHLLNYGKITTGKLIGKRATNTQINKRTVYELAFQFQAEDGQTYEVKSKTHTPEILEDDPQERLLYDAGNPSYAVLFDNLPGHPRMDQNGIITEESLISAFPYLIVPFLTVFGHGLYFLSAYVL